MLRISGYGQTGPYRDLPGFGAIGEAMGGLRHLTGEPGRVPVRCGVSIGDTLAAPSACTRDNVAIVANDGGLPAGTVLPGGLVLREKVPQGHKVALVDIARRRAGAALRRAHRPRAAGHRRRQLGARAPAEMPEARGLDGTCRWPPRKPPPLPPLEGYTFEGYRNADGSVGTRNILAITQTVQCVAGVTDFACSASRPSCCRATRTSTTWWRWSTATAAAWPSTRPTP
jgi:hypothetical protein